MPPSPIHWFLDPDSTEPASSGGVVAGSFNQMAAPETNTLSRDNNELEQTFERMKLNCELALEIIRRLDPDHLDPASCERLYNQIHTLREIVRILNPEFEKKLIVTLAVSRRDLSPEEVLSLFYGLDEL